MSNKADVPAETSVSPNFIYFVLVPCIVDLKTTIKGFNRGWVRNPAGRFACGFSEDIFENKRNYWKARVGCSFCREVFEKK
jgi:hypothetical protein